MLCAPFREKRYDTRTCVADKQMKERSGEQTRRLAQWIKAQQPSQRQGDVPGRNSYDRRIRYMVCGLWSDQLTHGWTRLCAGGDGTSYSVEVLVPEWIFRRAFSIWRFGAPWRASMDPHPLLLRS